MSEAGNSTSLSPEHRNALRRAYVELENPNFAGRLADLAGQPLTHVLRFVPKSASDTITRAAQVAVLKCLSVAINSIEPPSKQAPAHHVASVLAGVSGGISGFFGLAALPIELPVTTTLMLRAIARIARHHGEDLSTLDGRLACVEVFALGASETDRRMDLGYYASRTLLGRLTGDVSSALLERGAANASAPAVNSLITEIAARFGIVVSERAAATALPVLGAVGGATINVIFMNHFQRVAEAHFTVRSIERRYGVATVRRFYDALAPQNVAARA